MFEADPTKTERRALLEHDGSSPAAFAKRTLEWARDGRLLELDSGHRPLLDALVSQPWSAPVWLTAFGVDIGVPVGVRDQADILSHEPRAVPIRVPDELQDLVTRHSGGMNLVKGVHDSCAPPLVAEARR